MSHIVRRLLVPLIAAGSIISLSAAASASPPVPNAPPGGPPHLLPKSFTGTPTSASGNFSLMPAHGGPGQVSPDTFSPAGCYVQANDPHLSTSVPGAASGQAFARCNYDVPLLCVEMVLYRDINGTWTSVGDNDLNYQCDNYYYLKQVTSKENPCVKGALYMVGGEAYSEEGGEYYYGGPVYSPEKDVC